MKREAIVLKASVNESLPDHLFKSEIEKYRDVWFSVLARYKKNNTFKCLRVPRSRDAYVAHVGARRSSHRGGRSRSRADWAPELRMTGRLSSEAPARRSFQPN